MSEGIFGSKPIHPICCGRRGNVELRARALGENQPARHVHLADQCRQAGDRPPVVSAVGVVSDTGPGVDHGRLGGGQLLGQIPDSVRGDAGDLGRPVRRLRGHERPECIESHCPVGDEVLVVEALRNDVVGHGERERAVGAGPYRQPLSAEIQRLVGGFRAARIDDHQLCALREPVQKDARQQRPLHRPHRVPAEDQHEFGVAQVRQRTPVAKRKAERSIARRVADIGMLEVIRRAECRAESLLDRNEVVIFGEPDQLLRSVRRLDRSHPLSDLRYGLIVVDLLPLVRSACAGALERLLEAIGIVKRHDRGVALRAHPRAGGLQDIKVA